MHQYIKNLFIFLPLFFGLKITEIPLLLNTVLVFIAFSLVASSVYIINDYFDIESDKKHPRKKHRPLANGTVTTAQAFVLMALLLFVGLSIAGWLSLQALVIIGAYVAINIVYSLHLKHIAIIDVTVIAIGFVLRLFVGSSVTGVPLSKWIVMVTFLVALFIALAKRRDDLLIYERTGQKMRNGIDGYTLVFLDIAMAIMASVVIVAYIMYTVSPEVLQRVGNDDIYLTTFFVVLGVLRYLQIVLVKEDSGSPTKIMLNDSFIQLTLLGWLLAFTWILY